jgi:hypothetical protein
MVLLLLVNITGRWRAAFEMMAFCDAQAVQGGVVEKRPWYEPSEKLLDQPMRSAAPARPNRDSAEKTRGLAHPRAGK